MLIVTVCTANLCRSPLAEHALRRALREHGVSAEVTSAGVRSVAGQSVPRGWAAVSADLGIDLAAHRPRLVQDTVAEADLFLVMTAGHAQDLALLDPSALGRVITLGEAADRLCSVTGADTIARLFPERQRAAHVLQMERRWDIADPVRLPVGEQQRVARHIVELCERLAGAWSS